MSFDRDEMPNWVFLLWQKYSVIQKYFNISDSTFTQYDFVCLPKWATAVWRVGTIQSSTETYLSNDNENSWYDKESDQWHVSVPK